MIYKGYWKTNGKMPIGKEEYRSLLNKPPTNGDYCMVYQDDVCMIDIDDYNHKTNEPENLVKGKLRSDILIEYLKERGIKYNGILTEHGKHFVFKKPSNYAIDSNKNNWYCALGIEVEIKVTKVVELIKVNGIERTCFNGNFTNDDIDELPPVLYPIQKAKNKPFDMTFKSGQRNNQYSSYAFHLASKGIKNNEIIEIITGINNYIVDEPLNQDELSLILRRETLEKLQIASSNSNKKVLDYQLFHDYLTSKGIVIQYNELTNDIEYIDLPDSFNLIKGKKGSIPSHLRDDIRRDLNLKNVSENEIFIQIRHEADSYSYNPVQDYMKSGEWDRTDRFKDIYSILGVNNKFHQMLIEKWFIQCVALAFNDYENPYGAVGVLILSGKEGIGKTSFFRMLTPNPKWFESQSQALILENKDIVLNALGHWIVEIGEIDTTFKRKNGELKAFITKAKDNIRKPYDRNVQEIVRKTSFCGTTNESEFLTNESGYRRWWNIPINDVNKEKLTEFCQEDNLKQFWYQCYDSFKNGKSFRLNEDEIKKITMENRDYTILDACEIELVNAFDFEAKEWEWWTIPNIKVRVIELQKFSNREIGNTLSKMMKLDDKIQKKRGNRGMAYYLPKLRDVIYEK